jgi:hypothetical protein
MDNPKPKSYVDMLYDKGDRENLDDQEAWMLADDWWKKNQAKIGLILATGQNPVIKFHQGWTYSYQHTGVKGQVDSFYQQLNKGNADIKLNKQQLDAAVAWWAQPVVTTEGIITRSDVIKRIFKAKCIPYVATQSFNPLFNGRRIN